MEKEIEHKFDLPANIDEVASLQQLKGVIEENGWIIEEEKLVERNFQYYDSLSLRAYKKGETIRRVGGFDSERDKGLYRYDFKVGPTYDRYEENYWSNEELTPEEILTRFKLHKYYQSIVPTAFADTEHHKMRLKKNGVSVELTLDIFDVADGGYFRELELELEHGVMLELNHLADKVIEKLKLNPLYKQKYDRVIESIVRFKEHYK